jgi:hypothetical protein
LQAEAIDALACGNPRRAFEAVRISCAIPRHGAPDPILEISARATSMARAVRLLGYTLGRAAPTDVEAKAIDDALASDLTSFSVASVGRYRYASIQSALESASFNEKLFQSGVSAQRERIARERGRKYLFDDRVRDWLETFALATPLGWPKIKRIQAAVARAQIVNVRGLDDMGDVSACISELDALEDRCGFPLRLAYGFNDDREKGIKHRRRTLVARLALRLAAQQSASGNLPNSVDLSDPAFAADFRKWLPAGPVYQRKPHGFVLAATPEDADPPKQGPPHPVRIEVEFTDKATK